MNASPKLRASVVTMDGQFESRFKNYDESEMNQLLSQFALLVRLTEPYPVARYPAASVQTLRRRRDMRRFRFLPSSAFGDSSCIAEGMKS